MVLEQPDAFALARRFLEVMGGGQAGDAAPYDDEIVRSGRLCASKRSRIISTIPKPMSGLNDRPCIPVCTGVIAHAAIAGERVLPGRPRSRGGSEQESTGTSQHAIDDVTASDWCVETQPASLLIIRVIHANSPPHPPSTELPCFRAVRAGKSRTDEPMPRGNRRSIVFALVVAIHVLLVCALQSRPGRSLLRPEPLVAPISAAFVERPPSREPVVNAPAKARNLQAPDVTRLESNTIQFDSEPITPPVTDWSATAHDAAAAILERSQRKPVFSHPPPDVKPGVFGSLEQNHRAGTVEDGTRYWTTDNCYFDFPRGFPPRLMAGEVRLKTPVCKPPPTGGGSHMFDDLKPQSLRNTGK
jgi:hypothetical protein